MKVCVVVLNSLWFDPRVTKQIRSYTSSDVDVVAVGVKDARYNKEEVDKLPCLVRLVDTAGVNQYMKSLWQKLRREYLKYEAMASYIVKERPDVIHANDLDVLLPCYIAARKLKCTLIYDTHEIFLDNYRITSRKLVRLYYQLIETHISKRIDAMVCVSHSAAEYLKKKYKVSKLLVITNCVSTPQATECIPKQHGFEVLNHGMFAWNRGYELMIEAAALLTEQKDITLVIRGLGAIEQELHRMAEKVGTNNIRFDSPVHVSELIPLAARSHVGIAITVPTCLNYTLSVSNKLFEYAAAGLPVIMSDIPEHRYLNEKYRFGVIIPQNTPVCLAQAILKLYSNEKLYCECVRNAQRLTNEVNWDKEFSELISFEKGLICN